jgi:hypothetical protein
MTRAVLSQAERLARSIRDEDARIEAWAVVVPAIVRLDSGDQKLVARAVRTARAISRHEVWALTRARAIAAIAVQLPGTRERRAMRLIDEAVTHIRSISDDGKRTKGLATLAAQIASAAPARAVELFEETADAAVSLGGGDRIDALAVST